jgi:heme/copper-type cytochrome/quinol oxidase subunit 4
VSHTDPAPQRHTPAGHAEVPAGVNLLVACTLAVLTLVAVGIAFMRGEPRIVLIVVLLAIAAVGVALELLYYMHLRVTPERRLFFIFFGSGVGLAMLMGIALAILLQFVIPAS